MWADRRELTLTKQSEELAKEPLLENQRLFN